MIESPPSPLTPQPPYQGESKGTFVSSSPTKRRRGRGLTGADADE